MSTERDNVLMQLVVRSIIQSADPSGTIGVETLSSLQPTFRELGTSSQTLPDSSTAVNVQIFSSSGTWIRPTRGEITQLYAWGGGQAGFSGSTTANGTGGSPGSGIWGISFPTESLPFTVPVTVGAGGTPSGGTGGTSLFGEPFAGSIPMVPWLCIARGAGTSVQWGMIEPPSSGVNSTFWGPGLGGAGGNRTGKKTFTYNAGATGGAPGQNGVGGTPGAGSSTVTGNAGGTGASPYNNVGFFRGGAGGGGGGASPNRGGAGGAGGFPGGGGGGGGRGTNLGGGAGGSGGAGLVVVLTW